MKLNFSSPLAESEIVGRLLGPDLHDGYSVATAVEPLAENGCVVTVRPVNPSELATSEGRVSVDSWGQPWLAL